MPENASRNSLGFERQPINPVSHVDDQVGANDDQKQQGQQRKHRPARRRLWERKRSLVLALLGQGSDRAFSANTRLVSGKSMTNNRKTGMTFETSCTGQVARSRATP